MSANPESLVEVAEIDRKGMSLSDYLRRYEFEGRFEIIEGEVVRMNPNLSGYMSIIQNIFVAIFDAVRHGSEWRVFTEGVPAACWWWQIRAITVAKMTPAFWLTAACG